MRRSAGLRVWWLAWLLAAACCGTAARAQPGPVLVTVKPVHSLVASLMAGVEAPVLLIEGVESPHGFSLRPSDMRRLHGARLLVRVGPTLEPFLERPLRSLPETVRVLTLVEMPGLRLLGARAGGAFEDDSAHEHGHGHAGGETDPHLWLDPRNAVRIAEALVPVLAEMDPGNAARYRRNGEALAARLRALDADLAARLAPLRGRPFVVFHDAYHYLETRYGLRAVAAVALSPERTPSVRRVREIRDRIRASGARCAFREPQFRASVLATLTEGLGITTGVMDPIGFDVVAGPDAYFQIMEHMAGALLECLGAPDR